MIPLQDNIPPRVFPIVNYSLIALTSLCYLVQFMLEEMPNTRITETVGMVPARVLHPSAEHTRYFPAELNGRLVNIEEPLLPALIPNWLTLLSCVFLHGSWMHLIGNMWFLHIFGDNVEDRLGHVGYLIFYLLAGLAASLTHLFTNMDSTVPTVGASGAIAGVMGAYTLLYPKSVVLTLVPLGVVMQTFSIPAPFFLGIWFVMQLFQGMVISAEAGGVAWWAHIGGFVMGFAVAGFLRAVGETKPPVEERRFPTQFGRVKRFRGD